MPFPRAQIALRGRARRGGGADGRADAEVHDDAAVDAAQAGGGGARRRLPRDLRATSSTPRPAEQAVALLAVRRAVLSDPLPAAQQHPRLAADDRRGPAGGGLRSCPRPPTPCPRSAAASARRTACAKAPASSSSRATARSPSARSRRYLTDTAWEKGWVEPLRPAPTAASRVGIIGAGPGGPGRRRAAARAGYAVTVYDRHDRAGGLLIYGIPGFKLEKDVVERRTRAAGRGRRRLPR